VRHRKGFRKLNRPADQRIQMLKALTTALIKHGKIKTTVKKAKEARRMAEKVVALAKQGTLHSRRQAAVFVRDAETLKKLFADVSRFDKNPGGCTRITRVGRRMGDATEMVMLELVA
jgi:large subunit ribosomal protein L17